MTKTEAVALLGGSVTEAARRIGVTQSAISQWPQQLQRHHEDRVLAALWRQRFGGAIIPACKEKEAVA